VGVGIVTGEPTSFADAAVDIDGQQHHLATFTWINAQRPRTAKTASTRQAVHPGPREAGNEAVLRAAALAWSPPAAWAE